MNSKDIAQDISTFSPSPGFLLVEVIEEKSSFRPIDKPDDSQTRLGKVLAIGPEYTNDFGTIKKPPPVEIGSKIAFRWLFNNDELEVNYIKYPIVAFNEYRGKFE